MDTKKIDEFIKSLNFKKLLWVLGVLIAVGIVFQAGMFVGFRKASFSYRFGDNYYRAFGGFGGNDGRGGRMMSGFPDFGREMGMDFSNSHGATGKILKISLPNLLMSDISGIERVVVVRENTEIRRFRDFVKSTELKVDDNIIVIGAPNDKSEIEAKLIRIMPFPPIELSTTSAKTK